jgi:hypothetical protein
MRFWTTPHPVPYLCTDNGTARGYMCSVFEISELYPLDYDSIMILLRFDQDIIRLDIWNTSAHRLAAHAEKRLCYRCGQYSDRAVLQARAARL